MYKELFRITPVSQIIIDSGERIVNINASALQMLGIEEKEWIGQAYHSMGFIPIEEDLHRCSFTGGVTKIGRASFETEEGAFELLSLFNITRFKEEMGNLMILNNRLKRYINESNLIFLVLDLEANIQMINQKGLQLLKIDESFEGLNWIEHFIPAEDQENITQVFNQIKNEEMTFDNYIESVALTSSGEKIFIGWHNSLITCEGKPEAVLALGVDLTQHKIRESELVQQATKDSLTHTYSREPGLKLYELEFAHARRQQQDLTVCFVDIDNLKTVNDTYGHLEGDRYIREMALLIHSMIRNHDTMIRYGGDEFLVVFPRTDCEIGYKVVGRIENALGRLNQEDYFRYPLSFSYGIASMKNNEDKSLMELLDLADNRMYEMKKGRTR